MVPGRAFLCERKAFKRDSGNESTSISPLTTNCHSIFETVVEIFHDLILEGDHARLCLPPSCASVARFKSRDFETDRASSKFTIKDPLHSACGKNFGRDHH